MSKLTYEDKEDVIDDQINRKRSKWRLNALAWLDFEDVSQIIRIHIHEKWSQWDQTRPIEPWLNTLISNQIKNLLRNNYLNFAKPCVTCPHNQSYSDMEHALCAFTPSGLQCSECPQYDKWLKNKKIAYDVKVPVSLDAFSYQKDENANLSVCTSKAEVKLHRLMKAELNDKHFFVYKMLFIDYVDEEQIALILGYKTNEKGRKAGYKQIKNLKNYYKKVAKELIEKYDIFL